MKKTQEVENPIIIAAQKAKRHVIKTSLAGKPVWMHPKAVTFITFAMLFSDSVSLMIMLSTLMNDSMALLMAVTVCCAFAMDGSASLAGILLKMKTDPVTKDKETIPFYLLMCAVAFGVSFLTSGTLQIALAVYGTGAAVATEAGAAVSGAGALEAAVGSPAAIITAVFLSLLRGATSAVCLALGFAACDPQMDRKVARAIREIDMQTIKAVYMAEKGVLLDIPDFKAQIEASSNVQNGNIETAGAATEQEARQKMTAKVGTADAADKIAMTL